MEDFISGVVIGAALILLAVVVFDVVEKNIRHDVVMECVKTGQLKTKRESYECKKSD